MLQGATNSPLNGYKNGTYQSPARGVGYFQLNAIDNTPIPATSVNQVRVVSFTATECVMVSPFYYESKEEQAALFGTRNLQVNINFEDLTKTLWSQFALPEGVTGGIQSVAVVAPELLLQTITPKVGFQLPKRVVYDVCQMQPYIQASGAGIGAGQVARLSNNNIKMGGSVPSRIFIFARRPTNTLTMGQGNTFLQLQGISITVGNQTGLLADASTEQLWELSRSNGLEQEYEEFSMRKWVTGPIDNLRTIVLSGGVLSLDPAKDLGLEIDQTNGSSGALEISVSCIVANNDVVDYPNVDLVVVGLYEGVLNLIDGNTWTHEQGIISKADVLSAQKLAVVYESQISGMNGGNRHLGRRIREGLKKSGAWLKDGGAKKIMDGVKTAARVAKEASQMASMVGLGITGAGKPKRKTKRKTGSGLTGGKALSRNQLLAIMNQ